MELIRDKCNNKSQSGLQSAHASFEKDTFENDAIYHAIDENVIHWINLINSIAPNAAILPVCISDEYSDDEALIQNNYLIEMQLEQRQLEHTIKGTSYCKPNVIFDKNGDIKLVRSSSRISGFTELREKTIKIVKMKQHNALLDESGRNHPATIQALEIIGQLQQSFHVMKMTECMMYIRSLSPQMIPEEKIDKALESLLAKGDILCFNNLGKEVEHESVSVVFLSC